MQSSVTEGSQVKAGDTLAKINQNAMQQSLKIAIARAESTAALDSAESRLTLTRSQLDAIKSLVNGGHTNKYEVEQKEAEHQQAYGQYQLAKDESLLNKLEVERITCLLYTSPSPRDQRGSRMPSSA